MTEMQISLFFTSKELWQGHFNLTAKLKGHKELLQLQAIWIMNEITISSWENFWQNLCIRHTNSLKSEPFVLASFCEKIAEIQDGFPHKNKRKKSEKPSTQWLIRQLRD